MIRRPLAQRVGRFRLLEELGRGGMGVVYRATDPSSGRMVALKVLLAADHAGDQATRRFQKEAETARLIEHPNVVKVHELGWHEGKPYFTMDLVDGGSLEALRGNVHGAAWYARVMAGVARGLHAAHARGLAHRDVKPSNILMEHDVPRLTDFGLARELSSVGPRLTATGEVLGTPHYMAPEQARGTPSDPALGDQYSVGAVLYDLLAGRPPHDGDSAVAVMMSLTTQDPPPLRQVAPGVPDALARVVEQSLARDPLHRYGSCEALAEDLDRFVAGEPVRATVPTIRRRLDRVLRTSRRPLVLAGTACAVALLTLGGAATWQSVQAQRHTLERELVAQGELITVDADLEAALSEGDGERAVAVLAAHAARHRGTRTAVDTVLRHTPALAKLAPERALALLAEAYTDAPDPLDQDRVLDAMSRQLEAEWDWAGLAALTATQTRRHPLRASSPGLARPRGRVQLALGDGARAADTFASVDDPAAASLARAVGQLSPAPEGLRFHRAVDWDGDGRADLSAHQGDQLYIHTLAPGLPRVASLPLAGAPGDERVHLLPDRHLVHWSDGVLRLLDASGPAPTVVAEREASVALAATTTDLNGDGTPEVYVGLGPYERRLLMVDLAHPEEGFVEAHAATTAAGSDVNQLLPVSTDAGNQLWAAVGPWRAYDVRRYAYGNGRMELLQRRRLGHVSALSRLSDGRVAALHSEEYGSRVALDPTAPFGEPAGIYVLGPDTTEVDQMLLWRGPRARLLDLHEVDMDGDGRLDWVVSARRGAESALVVHLRDARGFREPLVVPGFVALAAAQLDDDPGGELVVSDGDATFVMGAGEPRPVPPPPTFVEPAPAPEGLDPAGEASWQRAEDLVAMGLYAPAAGAFTRLHDQLPEALAPAALARAAHLYEAHGDRDAAAGAWSRLVGRDSQARSAAVRLLRAAHRHEEAAAIGGEPPPDDDTRWDLVGKGRVADALTLLDPVGAQVTADGLAVDAVAHEGPLAGVRLPWTGQHLAVELELDLTHMEWGSGLVLDVEGWSPGTVAVRSWGGGGLYRRQVECLGTPDATLSMPSPSVALDETWTLRLDWFAGELLCQITAPNGETSVAVRAVDAPPAGDLDLSLRPAEHAPDSHALARAVVRRWSVTATQQLPALSARTRPKAAPSAAHRLRTQPAVATAQLIRELGPDVVQVFRDAHRALQHSHPDAPVTQRVYTVHAAPILAMDPARLPLPDRQAHAELLARRGMAWLSLGELEAARADLQSAARLLGAGPTDDPEGLLRVDVGLALAAAWVDHAPETARRHLREALQLHPVPELARDRLARFPTLQELEETWP